MQNHSIFIRQTFSKEWNTHRSARLKVPYTSVRAHRTIILLSQSVSSHHWNNCLISWKELISIAASYSAHSFHLLINSSCCDYNYFYKLSTACDVLLINEHLFFQRSCLCDWLTKRGRFFIWQHEVSVRYKLVFLDAFSGLEPRTRVKPCAKISRASMVARWLIK